MFKLTPFGLNCVIYIDRRSFLCTSYICRLIKVLMLENCLSKMASTLLDLKPLTKGNITIANAVAEQNVRLMVKASSTRI